MSGMQEYLRPSVNGMFLSKPITIFPSFEFINFNFAFSLHSHPGACTVLFSECPRHEFGSLGLIILSLSLRKSLLNLNLQFDSQCSAHGFWPILSKRIKPDIQNIHDPLTYHFS